MPAQVQPLAVPLMAQTLFNAGSSRAQKIAENVALITAAIRAAYGSDDGYQKLIEDLRKEIQELKEEKMRREQEEILKQVEETFTSVENYIKALEAKIEQLESEDGRKSKDEIDILEETLEKIERTKEKLKRLGLIKEREEPDIDLTKAEEILRKAGYKIEKPLTWDTLQNYIEEQMKKIREEAKKEAMEELKIEEKRLAMITDLITTAVGAAFEAMSSSSSEVEFKGEELKRRFEEWRQRLLQAEQVESSNE
jgi:hypothetical protein